MKSRAAFLLCASWLLPTAALAQETNTLESARIRWVIIELARAEAALVTTTNQDAAAAPGIEFAYPIERRVPTPPGVLPAPREAPPTNESNS